MMNLIYDKCSHQDLLIDNGQLCFDFASFCNSSYSNKPLSWPLLKGVVKLKGILSLSLLHPLIDHYILEVHCTNKLKLKKDRGYIFDDYPSYIKPENCCVFTGYFDINGLPLYTKDYVKIDELGWTGFIFQVKDGISVRGAGGFSYYPNQIQRIGNPTLGELTENAARHILSFEKEFMDENEIPFNFYLD